MPKRPTSPGIPPAAARSGTPPGGSAETPDEAVVNQEWKRIESDRVAEEVAEAREDLGDTHPSHPSAWLWGGFAAALLAGVVFAVVVNVALAARRPAPAPPPPPAGFRPPSPNELGPGVGADAVDPEEPPAENAAPPSSQPTP